MNHSLYTDEKIDFTKEPIFFGSGRNIQRYEQPRFPFFDKLSDDMWSLHWTRTEVSLTKDKTDFANLSPSKEHIFTSNIKFQTLLDSVQGRAPFQTFGQVTTLPEVEDCLIKIDAFEALHSKSYTHILRNIYTKPQEILDDILTDDMIVARAKTVTKYYDDFYNDIIKYQTYSIENETPSEEFMKKIRKSCYKALINLNILEGIRFYVSFACSFSFAENQEMEGNAKIIKFIARDEAKHLAFSQKIINIIRKDESEGFMEVIEELEQTVYDMYREAAEQEMEWIDYLFKDGSVIGLNAALLKQYMMYLTNLRLQAIGYKPIFEKTENPLTWMDHWLSSKNTEVAPMETEISSYLIGSLDKTLCDSIWEDGTL